MASTLKVTEITTPDGTGNITVSRPLSSVQLGGVLDVNGNYVQTEKGGDIASASPLVIDTDGDYFDVTGTTNFAAMTVAADRQFTLQFDGALTMTHHATNLDLPGEANITTAAGDVAVFQSTGANTVQCISYVKADGTAVVGAGFTSAALATRTSTQSISGGTFTKIALTTEVYDIDSEFDHVTNYRFTATDAGRYLCCGQVTYDDIDDGDEVSSLIYVNGSAVQQAQNTTGVAQDTFAGGSIVLNLSASDYVELFTHHGTGTGPTNIHASGNETYLSVTRIQ